MSWHGGCVLSDEPMRARYLDMPKSPFRRQAVVPIPLAAPSNMRSSASALPALDEIDLSRRARNVLRALGCKTLADVARLPAGALERARNCGLRTRSEIIDCVRARGVAVGDSPTISSRAVVVGWQRVELWDGGRVVAWCLTQDLARHPEWIEPVEEWAMRRVFRLVSFRRVGLHGLVRLGTGGTPRAVPLPSDGC
jgi:hypothetical protein